MSSICIKNDSCKWQKSTYGDPGAVRRAVRQAHDAWDSDYDSRDAADELERAISLYDEPGRTGVPGLPAGPRPTQSAWVPVGPQAVGQDRENRHLALDQHLARALE